MDALAVILEAPEKLSLRPLVLNPMGPCDVLVAIDWSGVSAGTEKLLWTGRMPNFPGMGYPLVPGYESVGRIVDSGADVRGRIGEWVFVPGANCFEGARGLFGGTARRIVLPAARARPIDESLGCDGILTALAATSVHAIAGGSFPDLIVGHGILGRLLARLTIACGAEAPTVWDIDETRRAGSCGYHVLSPEVDDRRDYRSIYDVSGDALVLDSLVPRLAKGGEIVLAGFYARPLSFAFPPAFMREARIRIAAEFGPEDLAAVVDMVARGALRLDGLITHTRAANDAEQAYPFAFSDRGCVKMVIDWRDAA